MNNGEPNPPAAPLVIDLDDAVSVSSDSSVECLGGNIEPGPSEVIFVKEIDCGSRSRRKDWRGRRTTPAQIINLSDDEESGDDSGGFVGARRGDEIIIIDTDEEECGSVHLLDASTSSEDGIPEEDADSHLEVVLGDRGSEEDDNRMNIYEEPVLAEASPEVQMDRDNETDSSFEELEGSNGVRSHAGSRAASSTMSSGSPTLNGVLNGHSSMLASETPTPSSSYVAQTTTAYHLSTPGPVSVSPLPSSSGSLGGAGVTSTDHVQIDEGAGLELNLVVVKQDPPVEDEDIEMNVADGSIDGMQEEEEIQRQSGGHHGTEIAVIPLGWYSSDAPEDIKDNCSAVIITDQTEIQDGSKSQELRTPAAPSPSGELEELLQTIKPSVADPDPLSSDLSTNYPDDDEMRNDCRPNDNLDRIQEEREVTAHSEGHRTTAIRLLAESIDGIQEEEEFQRQPECQGHGSGISVIPIGWYSSDAEDIKENCSSADSIDQELQNNLPPAVAELIQTIKQELPVADPDPPFSDILNNNPDDEEIKNDSGPNDNLDRTQEERELTVQFEGHGTAATPPLWNSPEAIQDDESSSISITTEGPYLEASTSKVQDNMSDHPPPFLDELIITLKQEPPVPIAELLSADIFHSDPDDREIQSDSDGSNEDMNESEIQKKEEDIPLPCCSSDANKTSSVTITIVGPPIEATTQDAKDQDENSNKQGSDYPPPPVSVEIPITKNPKQELALADALKIKSQVARFRLKSYQRLNETLRMGEIRFLPRRPAEVACGTRPMIPTFPTEAKPLVVRRGPRSRGPTEIKPGSMEASRASGPTPPNNLKPKFDWSMSSEDPMGELLKLKMRVRELALRSSSAPVLDRMVGMNELENMTPEHQKLSTAATAKIMDDAMKIVGMRQEKEKAEERQRQEAELREKEEIRKAKAELRKSMREERQNAALARINLWEGRKTRMSSGVLEPANYSSVLAVGLAPKGSDGVGENGRSSRCSSSEYHEMMPPPAVTPPQKKRSKKRKLSQSSGEDQQVPLVEVPSVLGVKRGTPAPTANPRRRTKRRGKCPLPIDKGWVKRDKWFVETIVASRIQEINGRMERIYKVKWEDWTSDHNSWIREKDLGKTTPLLEAYWGNYLEQMNSLNAPIPMSARPPLEPEPKEISYFYWRES